MLHVFSHSSAAICYIASDNYNGHLPFLDPKLFIYILCKVTNVRIRAEMTVRKIFFNFLKCSRYCYVSWNSAKKWLNIILLFSQLLPTWQFLLFNSEIWFGIEPSSSNTQTLRTPPRFPVVKQKDFPLLSLMGTAWPIFCSGEMFHYFGLKLSNWHRNGIKSQRFCVVVHSMSWETPHLASKRIIMK